MLCRLTQRTAAGTITADPTVMINRLADYEDTGFSPEDLKMIETMAKDLAFLGKDFAYMKELLNAAKEGRINMLKPCCGKCCGNCNHFLRYCGGGLTYATGVCEVKMSNRCSDLHPKPMEVSNSKHACREFEPRGRKAIRYQAI